MAGGAALFGAWLAWIAVREQMETAERHRKQAQIKTKEMELNNVRRTITEIDGALDVAKKVLHFFEHADTADYESFADALGNASRAGELRARPGGFSIIGVNDCLTSLQLQQQQLANTAIGRAMREQVEEATHGQVEKLRAIAQQLERERDEKSRMVRNIEVELGELRNEISDNLQW